MSLVQIFEITYSSLTIVRYGSYTETLTSYKLCKHELAWPIQIVLG